MWKWIFIGLGVLIAALVVYRCTAFERANQAVADELRTDPLGERAERSMVITLADGRAYPVNYLREGNRVFMGIDGLWWRAFRGDGAPVSMLIQGESLQGHARVILDDAAYKADVFGRLRPTVPKWLPDWLNGKLVVITLDAVPDETRSRPPDA